MTVRTEKEKIGQAIIGPIAVHMVQRHADRFFAPFREAALLASILFDARIDEALFQMPARRPPADHQEVLQWDQVRARDDVSATDCARPRRFREPEALAALERPKPSVMSSLNGRPVIAAAETLVDRDSESPHVVRDGAFVNAQDRRDLSLSLALTIERFDRPAGLSRRSFRARVPARSHTNARSQRRRRKRGVRPAFRRLS
jgi:hypothetical protein